MPELGLEDLRKYQGGFHAVASFRPSINSKVKKRGRALNIQPSGIVDYSAGNAGYSPINMVSVSLSMSASEAAEWLRKRVGGGAMTPSQSALLVFLLNPPGVPQRVDQHQLCPEGRLLNAKCN
ncbi:hypothetical protein [Bradyrhizobium diazoefficiens]|uniref:hypothetical protein n=1 Tax=Bradyrhizobium diazoefficiens TaxID=1355477 RepID=UPI003518A627